MTERKILIVDDDRSTLELLRLSFKAVGGYSVVAAENGQQGLELALHDPPDLVLSDVIMPKMDGYELCRQLKQHPDTHSIPVFLLTARGDSESTVKGFQAGADDYIPKPFDPKEVLARMERALRWLERKTENAPKISGSLSKTPLFDLISFCEEHRISGILHLARWVPEGELSTKIQGKIHLHLGEIMAIQYQDIDDVTEALDELLEWQDGTFTVEQEELQLPALPETETETDADEGEETAELPELIPPLELSEQQSRHPKEDPSFSPRCCSAQAQESIHRILDELKIQAGNLEYADVAGPSGDIIHAVGPLAAKNPLATRKALTEVLEFSTRMENELDLGPLDETMILSDTGLLLLYQIEDLGTMAVIAPKEGQGMTRWNCKDAMEKIADVLSSS